MVPIYNAFEATNNLLKSLIKHNSSDCVVLINDASTDVRVNELFEKLPHRWQLINNNQNLGFVKTANIGLRLTSDHSILLNSDTIVTENWLDRFVQVINSVSDLGTATPWSNNAEICSIPNTLSVNSLPSDLNKLSRHLLNKHQPEYPELPTAVGFCMLLTAEAKQRVGYFDEATFGMGYGEENDYSLRVSQQGLKNVLVDNCYIAHVGNQSFQEISMRPNEQTMARLLQKHPDYLTQIQNFIENDPIAQIRESIIAKISAF